MNTVGEFLKEIEEATDTIWLEPPDELDNLKDPKGTYAHSFMNVNYLYHMLRNLAGFLWMLRQQAKGITAQASIPVKYLTSVAISTLDNYTGMIGLGGLTTTQGLLLKATDVLREIKKDAETNDDQINAQNFVDVMDRLSVYINKMSSNGWLDILMKWPKISCAYELME